MSSRGFTGHRHNDDLGLVYMNARFYLSDIGRFASADTLIPNPTNPQSFNRYSYSYNNPVMYTDPSGHCAENGDEACWSLAESLHRQYYADWNYLAGLTYAQLTSLQGSGMLGFYSRTNNYLAGQGLISSFGANLYTPNDSHSNFPTKTDMVILLLEEGEAGLDLYKFATENVGLEKVPIFEKLAPGGWVLVGSREMLKEFQASGSFIAASKQGAIGIGKDFLIDEVSEFAGAAVAGANPLAGVAVYVACQFQCESMSKAYVDLIAGSVEAQLRMAQYVETENAFLATQMRFNPSLTNPWIKPFDLP